MILVKICTAITFTTFFNIKFLVNSVADEVGIADGFVVIDEAVAAIIVH